MNRKLDHSLIALTAIGLGLVAIALFATPAGGPADEGMAPVVESTPAAEADGRGRRSRLGHRGLAMPYFSFARGVRRIGG